MKRRIALAVAAICVAVCAYAQREPITMKIWDGVPPTSNGQGVNEESPEIQVYLPGADKANGQAVLLCPGGGYVKRAMKKEGSGWAPYFNERGIACVVVKYRLPFEHSDVPISDLVQAMRVVRKNAKAWNIDPEEIGVMGSSAGGHLASTLSGHAPVDARPNFQILLYPVITLEKERTRVGSHTRPNLIGENASRELEYMYSNDKHVRVWTPKTILILADDDASVPSHHSVSYYLALKEKNIPASMFIYPSGGHGFGMKESFKYHDAMLRDLDDWLRSIAPKKK